MRKRTCPQCRGRGGGVSEHGYWHCPTCDGCGYVVPYAEAQRLAQEAETLRQELRQLRHEREGSE